MGTRGLTGVVLDGDLRVAQYGQWDHYPQGQGQTALDFVRGMDESDFHEKVKVLRWATEEDLRATYVSVDIDPNAEYISLDQADAYGEKYPHLDRDAGAKILSMIAAGGIDFVKDGSDFANDSLFCEYAYVVNLDERTLEIYRGFQTEPHTDGRFASETNDGGYWPIRLVQTLSFDDLPDELDSALISGYDEDEDDGV